MKIKGLFLILLGIFTLLRFLLFPAELTGDSYGYVCEIIKGDLWNPHHLFHKFVLRDIWIVFSSLKLFSNPLVFFQFLHLFAGVTSVLVMVRILQLRHWKDSVIFLAVLMVLSSFAFLKYSGENEVYFYPILLSLIGSLYFEKGKYFIAAVWLGVATLFHQIHIFWLIGVLFPKPRITISHYYPLFLGLLIPVMVYISFSFFMQIPMLDLLFHDVNQGLVHVLPDTSNFKLFSVNFIRIFIQIHGDLTLFWKLWNPYYSGLALLNLIIIGIGWALWIKEKKNYIQQKEWIPAYTLASIFHLFFAWYSVGNLEFMIVIPFLFVLSFRSGEILNQSGLLFVGILIWNFSQWIIPMSIYPTQRLQERIHTIERISAIDTVNRERPTENASLTIFSKDADWIQNFYEYQILKDSTISATRRIIPQMNFKFVNNSQIDSIDYLMIFQHNRINRSKLESSSDDLFLSKNQHHRLYRDSGMMGVLEVWRTNNDSLTHYQFK